MAAEGGSAAIKREDVPIGICSKEGLSGYGSLVWGGRTWLREIFCQFHNCSLYINRIRGLLEI